MVVTGDRFPHVTGSDEDGGLALQGFEALSELIERRYRPAVRMGDVRIFRLAGPEPSATTRRGARRGGRLPARASPKRRS